MIKLYGSSSGFLWGQTAVTTYDSACLRSIVFKMLNSDIRTEIPEKYMRVGEHHETWWATELVKTEPVQLWEIPSRREVTDGVQYSGRADFITPSNIYETKGSLSLSAMNYVIKKRQYKVGHVAQLASYFWQFEMYAGAVVFGAYKETEDGFKQLGHTQFPVKVMDDGRLQIDGRESPYFMQDLLSHVTMAADLLTRRKVHQYRPLNWEAKFGSPCGYCLFKDVCNEYDEGELDDEGAIEMARGCLGGSSENTD